MHIFFKKLFFIILALLILAGFIIGFTQLYPQYLKWGAQEAQPITTGLPGTLIFTLNDQGSDTDRLYTLDISMTNASPQVIDPGTLVDGAAVDRAVQATFSPNGNWATFLAASETHANWPTPYETGTTQVYRVDLTGNDQSVAADLDGMVTNATTTWKLLPQINNSGDVLYMSRGSEEGDTEFSRKPSDWTIYLVTTGGTSGAVVAGMYPKWVGGNTGFMYLADDGIHYYDLQAEEDVRVIYDENTIQYNFDMTFDVSDDGSTLVFSSLRDGTIGIYSIKQTDSGLRFQKQRILENTPAFWPTVSPDSAYVAILEYEPYLHLAFYRTADLTPVMVGQTPYVVGLADQDATKLFMTDWR